MQKVETNNVVNNIIGYLDSNLDDKVSIDSLAGKFYFNRRYLMHLFKKNTGVTITQYVNNKKIINSFDSLIKSDDKILKVALTNGYNSLEYYSEMFCKIVGISPNQFRKYGKEILESIAVEDSDKTKIGEARKYNEILEQIKSIVDNYQLDKPKQKVKTKFEIPSRQ